MAYIKCSQKHVATTEGQNVQYRTPGSKSRLKLKGLQDMALRPRGTQWFVPASADKALVDNVMSLQGQIRKLEAELKSARDKLEHDAKAYESIHLGKPPFKVNTSGATATVSFVRKITVKEVADTKDLVSHKIIKKKPVVYELYDDLDRVIGDILLDNYIPQSLDGYLDSAEIQFGVVIERDNLPEAQEALSKYLVKVGLAEGEADAVATEILLVRNYEEICSVADSHGFTADDFVETVKQNFNVSTHTRITVSKIKAKTKTKAKK